MTDRELDQLLAGEPEIQPSNAFAASVMKAVRREAGTPPPIGFPWLCLVPGLLACGLVIGVLIAVSLSESGAPVAEAPGWWPLNRAALQAGFEAAIAFLGQTAAGWILAGLLLTVACIAVPLRLMRGRLWRIGYGVPWITTRRLWMHRSGG